MGLAAALAGADELRLSPRHALLSSSFLALCAFLLLVLVPVSVYFYVFHGDWFLLYLVDVRHVPSALALIGFVLQALLGMFGFSVGASLVRGQHGVWAAGGLAACGLLALAVVPLCYDRLRLVGTYAQFRGGFGLAAYGGALMQGTVAMGVVLLVGAAFLVRRIHVGVAR
jgi:hypothetical protein